MVPQKRMITRAMILVVVCFAPGHTFIGSCVMPRRMASHGYHSHWRVVAPLGRAGRSGQEYNSHPSQWLPIGA
jgi:hypothetical protein